MHIYIAGPFFNEKQIKIVETIKEILDTNRIGFFSPKDECMFKQGDDPKYILDQNLAAIYGSDLIIVITDGKDTGTMFEAGYAYAINKPILYVWIEHSPEQKFNLMLGASGVVCKSYGQLIEQLLTYKKLGQFIQAKDDTLYE